MRKEFYVSPEGETHVVIEGKDRLMTQCPDMVKELHSIFSQEFSEAIAVCEQLAKNATRDEKDTIRLAVDRFLRCNFGNRDTIPDIHGERLELEEVTCHLRGICPYERVICKPRCTRLRESEERSIAELCLQYDSEEAAQRSYECQRSVQMKWKAVRERLKFKTNNELARYFRGMHLERRLALLYT